MFSALVGSLTALAVCMLAGYIGRKAGILTDTVNAGLSAVLVKFALPSMVFVSMMTPFSQTLLLESVATLLISAVVYVSGCFVGLALARLMNANDGEKRVWQFALTFANVAYMGFPVVYALYGYEGMIYTTMATASFNFLAFSLGVYLFKRGGDMDVRASLKAIALNPALIATYIGFIFFVTGLRLPADIQNGLTLLSNMAVPLSMMLVGALLAKNSLISLVNDWRVLPVLAMRLFGIPLAAFFVLRFFVHNIVMLEVIVLLVAMPAGALTAIFAEQYKGDTASASKIVALSSILCLLTIPIVSLIMHS